MNILITGSSGLVGSATTTYLFSAGHKLTCLQRNKIQKGKFWNTDALGDASFDAVIHLAGENIATGRWNKGKKKRIYDSRIEGTKELISFLKTRVHAPKVFLCASAVGFYGSRHDEILNEKSSKGTGFLSDICGDWEKEAQKISSEGTRVVFTRFGMVCSPDGGALKKMIPPFKMGLGGRIGSGQQFVSWISIRDIVTIIDFALNNARIEGPINVVAPQPTTNAELTKTLGNVLDKSTFFPLPAFMAKILLGAEMAEELLLASTRAYPTKLLEAGYDFQDKSLNKTLLYCTGKE